MLKFEVGAKMKDMKTKVERWVDDGRLAHTNIF